MIIKLELSNFQFIYLSLITIHLLNIRIGTSIRDPFNLNDSKNYI
jgi:hypothetical protein